MMIEDDRAWSMELDEAWPEDMEQRRIADLQKFQRKNPGYKWTHGDPIGGREASRPSLEAHQKSPRKRQEPSPVKPSIARWSAEATLELLEAMKVFVRANKVSHISRDKWEAVATRLPINPWGQELRDFARCCQSRYRTLCCQASPEDKKYRKLTIGGDLHRSLADYHLICERNRRLLDILKPRQQAPKK